MSSTQERAPAAVPLSIWRRFPWQPLLWFGLLLAIGYASVFRLLVVQWMSEPDFGHGFFVPLVAGYIIWQKRGDLMLVPISPNWWGAIVLAWATLQLAVAVLGAELFLGRTALLLSLTGAVLLMMGTAMLRALAFPMLLLLFMIPIPVVVFNQLTFPLQLLASNIAEVALSVLGVPVLREGNILELPSQRLSVVEACSGIRSLLSLSFLSLVYAYFFDSKVWMRWVLLAAAVPIALLVNAARVTLTGLISEYDRQLADGFFHSAEGWVMFMLALGLLVGVHQFVGRAWAAAHQREG